MATTGKKPSTSDVLIVGGGPAGSTCARKLVLGGASVTILDKAVFPRSKPCAGWITPRVLQLLEPLFGRYPHSLSCFPQFDISLWNFRFLLPTNQYAIRRQEFDTWLLQNSGTRVIHHQVREIQATPGGYLVDGQYFSPRLVGAGGSYCPVRRNLFPEARYPRPRRQKPVPDGQEPGSRPGESGPVYPAGSGDTGCLIVALEDEFPCLHHSKACRLWFFQEKLPGYAWYVPKVDGYVNIGVGGKARSLLQRGDSIKHHWNFLVQRLATEGLVSGRELHPTGYSYMLRGNNTQIHQDSAYLVGDAAGLATIDMGEGIGPAIQSALLAAEAILTNSEYTISGIPRYSFPSILGLRRENHHIALSYERR